MRLGDAAGAAGRGLAAGLAGTAAMTLSNLVEMKAVTGRSGSTVPAQAVEEVAGVDPADEPAERRLNQLGHWGYGTAQGALRGLLGLAGLRGPTAALAHYGVVWGAQQTVLPALGVAAPTWRYGRTAVAIDLAHHGVYTAATSLAYEWLDRRSAR
jgi:hypothetical protein